MADSYDPDLQASPPTPLAPGGLSQMEEFSAFFDAEYHRLVRLILAAGASVEEARDVAQETFLLAFRQWNEVEHPAAWIRRVALRTLFKNQGRSRRGTELVARLPDPGPEQSAEDTVVGLDEEAMVVRALRLLPPTQRQVMALVIDGLSPTEIAEVLGKTPTTIRSNLRLARKRLQQTLAARELGR